MVIPTLVDPTMAPPGKHMMSCFVQYCPLEVEGRPWTDDERQAFGQSAAECAALCGKAPLAGRQLRSYLTIL